MVSAGEGVYAWDTDSSNGVRRTAGEWDRGMVVASRERFLIGLAIRGHVRFAGHRRGTSRDLSERSLPLASSGPAGHLDWRAAASYMAQV